MTDFQPRPAQENILGYRGGKMGVAAVPGSGKTWTLSLLAARIIMNEKLADDQEVLIVTLVNSAVENFRGRIAEIIQERGLLPQLNYRVRTLHGLAHDIVRERPDLVGLADNFYIVDERAANQILTDVVKTWLRTRWGELDEYLLPELEEGRRDWVRRERLPELLREMASAYIKRAKDWQLSPEQLANRMEHLPSRLPLAEMGFQIYRDYQRALTYRGAVDFDDLIRLAVDLLEIEPDLLDRLRSRWPFILEDEAQDSSRLQEKILQMLAGPDGNWVRVGDPNQAIFETFTTADPEFLRRFLRRADVRAEELPNSGRSTASIISLANRLIDWAASEHPVPELRSALSPPHIQGTPEGDPQPNPPDQPDQVVLVPTKFSPQAEIQAVCDSLERWLPDHPDHTVAVLVPRNTRGFQVSEELRRRNIPFVEMLRSARETRMTAGALGNILNYLADPKSARKLATSFEVWRREDRQDPDLHERIDETAKLLRKCQDVESYLWPTRGKDWLDGLGRPAEALEHQLLLEFRTLMQRWHEATVLPVDQLVLTLAQDLFQEPAELALAHKLALVLKRAELTNTDWRLPELTDELKVVARNQRRFLGFAQEDSGFQPEKYRGTVVVSTMHKAKGLEWDRVYLMSVNNYDFPSAQEYDRYISEKWYVRDRLDLQAETLSQLENLVAPDEFGWYEEGLATERSRLEYAAERLRLLYVGITRAGQQLIVTWNAGRGEPPAQPAIPLLALQRFWEGVDHAA